MLILTTRSNESVDELPYPIRMFGPLDRLKLVVAATIGIGRTEFPESNATVNVTLGFLTKLLPKEPTN